MKTRLLILCMAIVAVSVTISFFVTNDVRGYSYVPLDCKIKDTFGYFSKEDPLNPNSKEFTNDESLKLLTDCFKASHPGVFQ